ncbi:MAG: glycosyltransferase family 2 protein [Phycisphaerales bacterium]
MTTISAVIPTRNRPLQLVRTLYQIGRLQPGSIDEVIVVDNASDQPPETPNSLPNGIPVRLVRLDENLAAAARNAAAEASRHDWLLMLDDDSHPIHAGFRMILDEGPSDDLFAIGGRIELTRGGHEAGGLPEVFVGCGALVRRDPFLELGGYDYSFEYYAEEYDLCARAIGSGWRIAHDDRLRVMHHKVDTGRDMNRIMRLLMRNNLRVIYRYAPEGLLEAARRVACDRYREIARHEDALAGFERGLAEGNSTSDQGRRPLSVREWNRFNGRDAVEAHLPHELESLGASRVAVSTPGKGASIIESVLSELGVEIVPSMSDADAWVIGTLSPGPMRDAALELEAVAPRPPVVTPWRLNSMREPISQP